MRVLIFGSSSAEGFWDAEGGWADRLKKHYFDLKLKDLPADQPGIMNLGVSDDTTGHILKRLEPEATARQNSKGISFIFQVGSNNAAELDGRLRSTTADYEKELEQIIERARQFSDKILVVGFPAVDESKTCPLAWASNMYFKNANIKIFEDAAAGLCQRLNLPFVPLHEQFQKSDENLQAHDGLHPNDEGHQLIFELVRPELDELLAA